MRVLLDTNSLIWFLTEPSRLSTVAKHSLVPANQQIAVSLVSLWELAIKISKGNLPQMGSSISSVLGEMDAQTLTLLPVRVPHLLRLERLPHLHKDPFDRLLIAQALEEELPVVTADRIFPAYGVPVIW